PLGEVTNDCGSVLSAVVPLRRTPDGAIDIVADDDVHRYAITPRVVDGHRGVLQTHRAMREHGERLAFDFEIAVTHRDRRFLVAVRDELGALVAAVVDDRFLKTRKLEPGLAQTYSKPRDLMTSTM